MKSTVRELREQLAAAQSHLSSAVAAEQRRDALNTSDQPKIDRWYLECQRLRRGIIMAATWDDLESDEERDQYLVLVCVRNKRESEYLAGRLAEARNSEQYRKRGLELNREVRKLKDRVYVLENSK